MGLITIARPYAVAPVDDHLAWMADASCASEEARLIWDYLDQSAQVRVCSDCLVVDECRAYGDRMEGAQRADDLSGVYAGETVRQRYRRRYEERSRARRDSRETQA